MELRLHPHSSRDKRLPHEHLLPLRISHEIPFSPQLLRSIRVGAPPEGAAALPERNDARTVERRIAARVDGYERDARCDHAFRCGQWLLMFVAIAFVTVVVVMLSMVFVKVGAVLDRVGGASLQDKVDHMLDHAMQAAVNTETVTSNAVTMSALAKSVALEAHPKLVTALNRSSEMMEELRDFSLHPQWTISGGLGGRRRD